MRRNVLKGTHSHVSFTVIVIHHIFQSHLPSQGEIGVHGAVIYTQEGRPVGTSARTKQRADTGRSSFQHRPFLHVFAGSLPAAQSKVGEGMDAGEQWPGSHPSPSVVLG